MCKLNIYGGKTLQGSLRVQGSKNSVLPILAATLLCQEVCEIQHCPDLTDVHAAFEILEGLGCRVDYDGETAVVDTSAADRSVIPEALMRRMRSSVMFLGAMLGRFGRACISYPGGCELGARPIDMHMDALRRLGVELREEGGDIRCLLRGYLPQTITLMFPSVGVTENVMLLCAAQPGETLLVHPAREPEIVDLQNFLNCMGASVVGAGSDCIRIRGVKTLHGCKYRVISDRIAAATYVCAAAACGGEVLLTDTEPEHMRILLSVMRDMGVGIQTEGETVRVISDGRPEAVPLIKTLPYPGFPTDMQPLLMAAMLKAKGSTVFNETIFENRFKHVGEFLRMGAEVRIEGMNAMVSGVRRLHGAAVQAADLRGGAALVIAGLNAEGKTVLSGTEHIRRGYAHLDLALKSLGAHIEWAEMG